MSIFLFAVSFYGIVHLYIYMRIHSTFHMDPWLSLLTGSFFFFMTISPLFVHRYALKGHLIPSRIFAYAAYLWMAVVFFYFSSALLIDVYDVLARGAAFMLKKKPDSLTVASPYRSFIPLLISILCTAYGYAEAVNIRVRRLTVKTSKLPEGTNRLTVAHITDLHLGLLVRDNILEKVIKVIEDARPDVIVSTGDLIDIEVNHIDPLIERLRTVQAPLGKYASMGNHEFFVGIKNSAALIEKAGFTILRNRAVTLEGLLTVAGIDDRLGDRIKEPGPAGPSEEEVLGGLLRSTFTLILKHRPEMNRNTLGQYDLQLSGHTHKGQMFPVHLFIKLFLYPHYSGYTQFYKGSSLYVSSGAGTTCCPVRFLAPPETTIIDIVKEDGAHQEK